MKKRKTYLITQGNCRRQTDGSLTNCDMFEVFRTLDKEEALEQFDIWKEETEGYLYNVVVTELQELQEYYDEEYNEWCYDDDYNINNDTTLEYVAKMFKLEY